MTVVALLGAGAAGFAAGVAFVAFIQPMIQEFLGQ